MEDYAAKMQAKPDAALREYVTGYVQYRDEAVLAALDELRRRGQPTPEEATLRPALEAAVAASQRAAAEAVKETATRPVPNPDAPEATGPALYSPVAIIFFSLFFTPLAGGVLLGLNLSFRKRWGALVGLLVILGAYGFGIGWLQRMGTDSTSVALLQLPMLLLYLLWFWPRYVTTQAFRSRSWLPPLLVCLVIFFGMAWAMLHSIPGFMHMTPQEQKAALRELMLHK